MRFFEANRAALQRRAALVPYTYTAARVAFDTGIGPLIPMYGPCRTDCDVVLTVCRRYYEYPHLAAAYGATMDGQQNQYFFGPDLIVSPVVTPASNSTNLAVKKLWVPPGMWYDDVFGDLLEGAHDGSSYITRAFDLVDTPLLVRAGAVIATLPAPKSGDSIGAAARQYNSLVFTVYPSRNSTISQGTTTVYEDDGATTDYTSGHSAVTTASYLWQQNSLIFSLSTKGTFSELPKDRLVTLHIINFGAVKSISVDGIGTKLPFNRFGSTEGTWSLDGYTSATIIRLAAHKVADGMSVVLNGGTPEGMTSSTKGMISRGLLAKAALDEVRTTPGRQFPGHGKLDLLAVAGEELSRGPKQNMWDPATFSEAVNEVNNMTETGARMQYVRGLLASCSI